MWVCRRTLAPSADELLRFAVAVCGADEFERWKRVPKRCCPCCSAVPSAVCRALQTQQQQINRSCRCVNSLKRRLQCEGRRQSGPFPVDKAGMGGSGAVPAGTVEAALKNGISFYEGLQVGLAVLAF